MEATHLSDILALSINFFGVICSIFSCIMNIFILKKVEKKKKKKEMALFYFRFFLDAVYGAVTAIYIFSVILFNYYDRDAPDLHIFIVFSAFFSTNIGTMRGIVSLTISVERVMAVCAPIKYRNYRPMIPTNAILTLILGYGVFEYFILYVICNYKLNIPYNCVNIGCAINSCYRQYFLSSKWAIYGFTFLFAFILSLKLLLKVGKTKNKDVTMNRANRLALIDVAIIFIFNVLLSTFLTLFDQDNLLNNSGPFASILRQLGCSIEALLVFRTVKQKSDVTSTSTTSKPNVRVKSLKD
ncbi:Serpentine Receptor, class BC (Class B-like) [Caenorhabditis elegans]|uniref:Serpentine Receptor, class BC (Class B-like) n=1 Tax=Caenorhabditis elegans TaxID=6239 RepID=Q9XV28_CAEEL|nr:Serpentine Receptor, class BC (Class B-like) [Caenorhabditis elegans]CAB04366.1 Serpentine Receptor, class BC (Class B-like) [Caenorhabditis elegans]|eukprot:NP_507346.1 Serpentine Receptor, class BC (class B-like) [Caenorhabditis elegans]